MFSGGKEVKLFRAIGFRLSADMHPEARMNAEASHRGHEIGRGESPEQRVLSEGSEGVEHIPLQRDNRVDAMERTLKDTDWNPTVKKLFLDFMQHAINFSPIARSDKISGAVKLMDFLGDAEELLTDAVERRTLEHLQQTLGTLEILVDSEANVPRGRESDRREKINSVQQALELALRASEAIDKEPKRVVLQMLCHWLESELRFVERPIEKPGDSTTKSFGE